ncbi:MAG: TraY domain-containing protein [Chlamydiota bacterium]
MTQKQTRDFLIRNMPVEVYNLLEKAAKEHHRSKTQEAIVALINGLSVYDCRIKKPIPFKWKKKPSSKFIEEAINEGRE